MTVDAVVITHIKSYEKRMLAENGLQLSSLFNRGMLYYQNDEFSSILNGYADYGGLMLKGYYQKVITDSRFRRCCVEILLKHDGYIEGYLYPDRDKFGLSDIRRLKREKVCDSVEVEYLVNTLWEFCCQSRKQGRFPLFGR